MLQYHLMREHFTKFYWVFPCMVLLQNLEPKDHLTLIPYVKRNIQHNLQTSSVDIIKNNDPLSVFSHLCVLF